MPVEKRIDRKIVDNTITEVERTLDKMLSAEERRILKDADMLAENDTIKVSTKKKKPKTAPWYALHYEEMVAIAGLGTGVGMSTYFFGSEALKVIGVLAAIVLTLAGVVSWSLREDCQVERRERLWREKNKEE